MIAGWDYVPSGLPEEYSRPLDVRSGHAGDAVPTLPIKGHDPSQLRTLQKAPHQSTLQLHLESQCEGASWALLDQIE